ncbi:MAG: hypothetical protein RI967_779 [Planctomycetota bacterium]
MPETRRHLQLKDLALAWLRAIGCRAVALEVSCPFHRYRFDALGWLDHADDPRAVAALGAPAGDPRAPRAIAVECKQSRADFASDDRDPDELAKRKTALLERRRVIEEMRVKVRETHLRDDTTSLFEELATWEFGKSRIAAYRKVLDELDLIDQKLGIDTKFAKLSKWRTADHLVVMTPAGLLRPREVPAGWGLVEVDQKALRKGFDPASDLAEGDPLPCRMRVAPLTLPTPEARRQRLLRNLAVAACRGVGYALARPRPKASQPEATPVDDTATGAPDAHAPTLFSPARPDCSDTIAPPPSPGSSVG